MGKLMADPVVEEYLDRLVMAARVLPQDQRQELVDGIAGHISEARESGAVTDEAGLRTLLDRLGEPADIVAAAREADDPGAGSGWPYPTPGAPIYRPPGTERETAAVLLLTVGSFLPVLGWLVGIVLVWTSNRWKTGEKLMATLVFPGGPFLVLWSGAFYSSTESCSSSGSVGPDGTVSNGAETCTSSGFSLPERIGIPLVALWVVLPIVVGIVLLVRARRRAALEPPVLVAARPPGAAQWGTLEIAAVGLIGLGTFLAPFVGPAAGLVCAWMSPAWTRSEKLVASAIVALPLLGGLFFLLSMVAFV